MSEHLHQEQPYKPGQSRDARARPLGSRSAHSHQGKTMKKEGLPAPASDAHQPVLKRLRSERGSEGRPLHGPRGEDRKS